MKLKNYKNFKSLLCFVFIIVFLFILFIFLQPIKESFYSKHINENYYVKPWDKFCIQLPPSCQKKNINTMQIDGKDSLGCWCNSDSNAPLLDNNPYDLEFDPYVEYRR